MFQPKNNAIAIAVDDEHSIDDLVTLIAPHISSGQTIEGSGRFIRCAPWRAKRRRVVPGSREARLLTRRAHSARGEAKRASERGVQPFVGVLRSQHRACEGVAKRHGRRAAGAIIGCRRSSAFWGLGCPKTHHEIEDSLLAMKAGKREEGSVNRKERLGGLLKYYHREAA